MKIAIACDHTGLSLKLSILDYLSSRLIEYSDFGTDSVESCDYPIYAEKVCKAILNSDFDRGILICATGIGMSITANKFNGIRAAACSDAYSGIFSKRHNDANVICLGAKVVGQGLAILIIEGWLNAAYEGGRHRRRLDIISGIENSQLPHE